MPACNRILSICHTARHVAIPYLLSIQFLSVGIDLFHMCVCVVAWCVALCVLEQYKHIYTQIIICTYTYNVCIQGIGKGN